jgi:hypothetical protein
VLSKGVYGSIDLGDETVNKMFAASPDFVVKRLCHGCTASHKAIYYKRKTAPKKFAVYNYLASAWTSDDNALHTDFDLYSAYDDAVTDTNAWQYCTFGEKGVGSFGNCAPSSDSGGTQGGQWVSFTMDPPQGQLDVAFYLKPANAIIGATNATDITYTKIVRATEDTASSVGSIVEEASAAPAARDASSTTLAATSPPTAAGTTAATPAATAAATPATTAAATPAATPATTPSDFPVQCMAEMLLECASVRADGTENECRECLHENSGGMREECKGVSGSDAASHFCTDAAGERLRMASVSESSRQRARTSYNSGIVAGAAGAGTCIALMLALVVAKRLGTTEAPVAEVNGLRPSMSTL